MKVWMVVASALVLCSVLNAVPTVWYVHPDSTLNSIQAALDTCADNDIVLVAPGTYVENIMWPTTQGIHLISELGPEVTVIDGNHSERVITMFTTQDSTTLIREFTIRNGYHPSYGGAGILCYNGASPTITENIITGNESTTGGAGIACDVYASPIIAWNTITGNTAQGSGAGIGVFNYSRPVIANNTITNNTANGYGGGAIYSYAVEMTISGNTIANNMAVRGGGIYFHSDSSSTVTDNIITGNTATTQDGGGIALQDCQNSRPTLIANNIISNNSALSLWGGGIRCANSSPTISGNTITGNSAPVGAGIYAGFMSSPDIDSCTIASNYGDGIRCRSNSNATINWCNIYDNTGYGICNVDSTLTINAENNWWGDSTGPYHPTQNPYGLGDTVSNYVDFIPWIGWMGIAENRIGNPVKEHYIIGATVISGALRLPQGRTCRVFDITGRVVKPDKMKPGVYFVEVDNQIVQKVVKVK